MTPYNISIIPNHSTKAYIQAEGKNTCEVHLYICINGCYPFMLVDRSIPNNTSIIICTQVWVPLDIIKVNACRVGPNHVFLRVLYLRRSWRLKCQTI